MPTDQNRQRVTDETTEKVGAAALEAFERYGLDRFTVQDVAQIARVSRPTVYRVFPDRTAMIVSTLFRSALDLNARIHASLDPSLPLTEAMLEIRRATIAYYQARPHRTSLIQGDGSDLVVRAAQSDEFTAAIRSRWEPYLERARERKELRDDVSNDQIAHWLHLQNAAFRSHGDVLGSSDEVQEEYFLQFAVRAIMDADAFAKAMRSLRRSRTVRSDAKG